MYCNYNVYNIIHIHIHIYTYTRYSIHTHICVGDVVLFILVIGHDSVKTNGDLGSLSLRSDQVVVGRCRKCFTGHQHMYGVWQQREKVALFARLLHSKKEKLVPSLPAFSSSKHQGLPLFGNGLK